MVSISIGNHRMPGTGLLQRHQSRLIRQIVIETQYTGLKPFNVTINNTMVIDDFRVVGTAQCILRTRRLPAMP